MPTQTETKPPARTADDNPADDADTHVNEVRLVGRLAAVADVRAMPSGDTMVSFRLVVARPSAEVSRARPRTPTIDTLDCVGWRGDVRRAVSSWNAGDIVEVSGMLRRRFWRGPHGPASRTEVEVRRAKRQRRVST
jgi:single-strand DNA-binding protein